MDLNNIHHIFKSIVDDFNLEDGQNRGLHLDYHILVVLLILLFMNLKLQYSQHKKKFPFLVTFCLKITLNQKFLEHLEY